MTYFANWHRQNIFMVVSQRVDVLGIKRKIFVVDADVVNKIIRLYNACSASDEIVGHVSSRYSMALQISTNTNALKEHEKEIDVVNQTQTTKKRTEFDCLIISIDAQNSNFTICLL